MKVGSLSEHCHLLMFVMVVALNEDPEKNLKEKKNDYLRIQDCISFLSTSTGKPKCPFFLLHM